MASFLTLQGFLFTALVFASAALASESNKDYRLLLVGVLVVVSGLGFVSPRLVSPTLRAAFRHVVATNEWWIKFSTDPQYRLAHPFPVLIGKRADSYGLFWFLRKQDEDDPYTELQLSCEAHNRIGIVSGIGLHLVPNLLTWLWLVFLFVFGGITGYLVSGYSSPGTKLTVTKITITEGQGINLTTISFEGDQSKIADLERRIKPIFPTNQP